MEPSLNLSDHLKTSAKNIFMKLFVEVLYVVLGFIILVMASAFLMYGMATGLGRAFNGELWLGYLITGALGVVLSSLLFFRTSRSRAKVKIENKSERRNSEIDLIKLIEKHPFYSAGIAATAGFFVGEEITSPGKSVITSLIVAIGEDVFAKIILPSLRTA